MTTISARGDRFWFWHAIVPAALFAAFVLLFAIRDFDPMIARAWAFDAAQGHFIGAGPGEWWAKDLLHGAGGELIRAIGIGTVALWLASFTVERLRSYRRALTFLVSGALASVALVGIVKATSNVDCPWSLEDFGGGRPYVRLFDDRPDDLPRAQCFPGGHSSSGFALFSLYFLYLERRRKSARRALALALAVGAVFAFGQEARGAHFLSHDAWSAAIAWFAALVVYAGPFRRSVWSRPGDVPVPEGAQTQPSLWAPAAINNS